MPDALAPVAAAHVLADALRHIAREALEHPPEKDGWRAAMQPLDNALARNWPSSASSGILLVLKAVLFWNGQKAGF